MNTGGKIVTSVVSVLLIGLGIFVFFKFFFVYSEGTNEGDINYFQREGFVFKYSGFLKSSERDENMSSKKYDANIGTTRHARTIQRAHLLSLRFFIRVDIIS